MTKQQAIRRLAECGVTDIKPSGRFNIEASVAGVRGVFDPRDLLAEIESRKFDMDGYPTTLHQFFADNDEMDPETVRDIYALKVGEALTFGGGAFVVQVLKRIA